MAEFNEELGIQTFDEIVEATLAAIRSKNVGITNTDIGSVIRAIVEVLSENEDTQNYYLEYVYKVMNIDNCIGEDLDRSAVILGLTRNPARKAIGEVTFYTGDSPASSDIQIPYGYIVSTRPNFKGNVVEFMVTDTDKVIQEGEYEVTCTVECTVAGNINIAAGSICILPSALAGVDSVANEYGINGGSDIENDESFLNRIHNVKETLGKCTDIALQNTVLAVPGVSGCSIQDLYDGAGTTKVIVVTDQIPAPASVQADIAEAVAKNKASGVYADITYTNIRNVDVTITIDVDSSLYSAIASAISAYFNSLTAGQTLLVKQLERKILNAVDDTVAENDDIDVTTLSPQSNIPATDAQVIRCGIITINGTVVTP